MKEMKIIKFIIENNIEREFDKIIVYLKFGNKKGK